MAARTRSTPRTANGATAVSSTGWSAAGITEWPRLDSGALQLDGDAFRMMYRVHPAIEGLHALRDSLGVIVRARIPIGRDGRNRPSLFPFGTATGRNAQAKSLFNAHASMRSFMRFPADKIGLYLDWRTQEVGVAAARSGDEALADDYLSGDVYHALALLCGLTDDPDVKRWKSDHPGQRQQMKALQLGINYGMGVRSLSQGPQPASVDRQRGDHPPPAQISDVLGVARRHGRTRHAGARDRVRVRRLAAAHQHVAEQAHALQFSDAGRRCRDAAAGG